MSEYREHHMQEYDYGMDCPYCEIARLTAELARYKQGVEVEVTVDSYDYGDTSFICEDIKLPSEFRGQRVRVLVMKEEE